MEARPLSRLDERGYRNLREQAAHEGPLIQTGELQRERELFAQIHDSVMKVYELRGTRVWGAFDDMILTGVVALSPVLLQARTRQLWLWGMYVYPRYRGTPASRLLMEAVLAWAERQYSGSSIMGSFHKNNRHAWQMVMRFGFVATDSHEELGKSGLVSPEHVVVECTRRPPLEALKSA